MFVLVCILLLSVLVVLPTQSLNISVTKVVFIGELFYQVALYCTVVILLCPPLVLEMGPYNFHHGLDAWFSFYSLFPTFSTNGLIQSYKTSCLPENDKTSQSICFSFVTYKSFALDTIADFLGA